MDNLVGVWNVNRRLGPWPRGCMTIQRSGSDWKAFFAPVRKGSQPPAPHPGIYSPPSVTGEPMRFVFPGNLGEFQGRLNANGSKITGHWIQPKSVSSGNSFATPVEFEAVESRENKEWSGVVPLLDDRLKMYLVIDR